MSSVSFRARQGPATRKGVSTFASSVRSTLVNKQFHDRIRQRWMQLNDRMKEVGVAQFFLEQNELPRY